MNAQLTRDECHVDFIWGGILVLTGSHRNAVHGGNWDGVLFVGHQVGQKYPVGDHDHDDVDRDDDDDDDGDDDGDGGVSVLK